MKRSLGPQESLFFALMQMRGQRTVRTGKPRATWGPWRRSPMHTISWVGGPNSRFSSSATSRPGPRWCRFTVGVASAKRSCCCASLPQTHRSIYRERQVTHAADRRHSARSLRMARCSSPRPVRACHVGGGSPARYRDCTQTTQVPAGARRVPVAFPVESRASLGPPTLMGPGVATRQ